MFSLAKLALLTGLASSALVAATPLLPASSNSNNNNSDIEARSSSFWLSNIQQQGTVPFGSASNYTIFRNVMDYGAKGDGVTDDTAAINSAISQGNRCGQGCDSSTTSPAVVYFPGGTYVVSSPLLQYYYTAMIGDPTAMPTLKASAGFTGMAVIDSDPYVNGVNWFTNQNNFFRQVRNFVIDLTAMPPTAGAGIHWQVAQATSLQNIVFNMVQGGTGNAQVGIFMDNGSGGFMTDLVFNGGKYGAFFGNQQFTTRNMTFNNCETAVFMNWNWLWTLKDLTINNCQVGVNMSSTPTVGSVVLQDSVLKNTPTGVITGWQAGSTFSNGSIIIDNVDFSGTTNAVVDASGKSVLAGGAKVASWAQGHGYSTGSTSGGGSSNTTTRRAAAGSQIALNGPMAAPSKPASLLDSRGYIFERSKPQYASVPASDFVSVKTAGAKGDGTTDDTAAIQKVLDSATADQVVYFDHGAYRITSTVNVPKNIKIVGEIWPLIMADGTAAAFSDASNPNPVFRVGQPGDTGAVEISDLIFETLGPAPGAILIEWNMAGTQQGAAGLWDTHARIGGSAGTGLQSNTCAKNPNVTADANPKCEGAFLLLHITKTASVYLENNWFWVADHELDLPDHDQINIFNGRGVLVESQSPVWMYGSSAEHSQLYNYQVNDAKNLYMGAIQTETPYWQSNPDVLQPFAPNSTWNDPPYTNCNATSCAEKTWGLRVVDSSDVLVYGAGLYSFFDNYGQTCLATSSCQPNMVSFEGCSGDNYVYALTTIGTTNMVEVDGSPLVPEAANRDTFGSSVAALEIV